MKVLVVSDTHGNFNKLQSVIEKNKNYVDILLHLGDGASEYLKLKGIYKNLNMFMVKGNCDFVGLPDHKVLNLEGVNMFACHGDAFNVKSGLEDYIRFGENLNYDIIAYGHTHKRFIQYNEKLCILNPGSLTLPRESCPGYAIISIENKTVKAEFIDVF